MAGDIINIYLADKIGFCGGVKSAIKKVDDLLDENEVVFSNEMLIHNAEEMCRLKEKGLMDFSKINYGSKILLRTHGTPREEKEELLKKYEVIDLVCPNVEKIQKIAEKNKDKTLIIFGKKNHPEVISINSYSDYRAHVIETMEDLMDIIDELKSKDDIVIVSQTTFKKKTNEEFLKYLDSKNIAYEYYDTVCNATKLRSESTVELAKKVDCLIVLGDKKSSNCTKLYEYAKMYNNNVFFINRIDEMDISEILLYNNIGITAGASTPDWIIKEAIEKMEEMNKSEMMEAIDSSFTKIKRGDILTGTVLYVTDSEITVNINYRTDGIINRDEVSDNPTVNPSDLFKAGDEIEVYVLKMDDGEGNVLLSHKRVQRLKNWNVVEEHFNNGDIVDAYVTEITKGGLKCEVEGINAFMPASQIAIRYIKDLSGFLDEVLASKIIDFNKDKKRVILSRKVVEEEEQEQLINKVYSSIEAGDVIDGEVKRLTSFGAFVDIGGIDGLIHISQLSWQRVNQPSEVVSPGDKIKVKVLNVDPENNRIALGLKQLTKEPWDIFLENNKIGDVVKGTVVNLLDFGAFVKLESGVDGLLHVSQIAREHVEKPSDKLEIGQEVEALITDIDNDGRKISLSIKELEKLRAREARAKKQENEKASVESDVKKEVSGEESENSSDVREKKEIKSQPRQNEQPKEEAPSFGLSLGDLLNQKDFNTEE